MKDADRPHERAGKHDTGRDLADVRASIAKNCARFAADPAAAAMAADVIITLRRTTTSVQTMMDDYAGAYDVSPAKIIVIMALAAAEGNLLTQAEMARQLAVSMGSLTSLLATLERAGIVRRSADAGDRRVSRVALTSKGTAFVRRFAPVHYASEAAAVSVLSAAEQRALLRLLDKLRSHMPS
jgi:DNA-binding MarR family transcriptional regulator